MNFGSLDMSENQILIIYDFFESRPCTTYKLMSFFDRFRLPLCDLVVHCSNITNLLPAAVKGRRRRRPIIIRFYTIESQKRTKADWNNKQKESQLDWTDPLLFREV